MWWLLLAIWAGSHNAIIRVEIGPIPSEKECVQLLENWLETTLTATVGKCEQRS